MTGVGTNSLDLSPEGLDGMTKASLLETAQALGVEGVSTRSTKAQIIGAIREVQG